MTWWAWRQHRAQVLAAAGVLAALAIWMVVTGLSFAHEYRDLGIASCLAARGDCGQAIDQFEALHRGLVLLVPLFLVAPGLIGVFWGAPLVAREVEAGTHRLAWTQSVSRRRWLSWQLGFLGTGTVVLSALFAWLVSWWSGPLVGAALDRFTPGIFDLRGIVPARGGRRPRPRPRARRTHRLEGDRRPVPSTDLRQSEGKPRQLPAASRRPRGVDDPARQPVLELPADRVGDL